MNVLCWNFMLKLRCYDENFPNGKARCSWILLDIEGIDWNIKTSTRFAAYFRDFLRICSFKGIFWLLNVSGFCFLRRNNLWWKRGKFELLFLLDLKFSFKNLRIFDASCLNEFNKIFWPRKLFDETN